MKRELNLFLKDILESIYNIELFSKGLTLEKLSKSKLKQSAIVRQIEIIGEAAKNIPNSFRNDHQSIPWKDIAGMRDVIIHGYFKVDLNAVWKVIKEDLPILKRKIKKILNCLEDKEKQ